MINWKPDLSKITSSASYDLMKFVVLALIQGGVLSSLWKTLPSSPVLQGIALVAAVFLLSVLLNWLLNKIMKSESTDDHDRFKKIIRNQNIVWLVVLLICLFFTSKWSGGKATPSDLNKVVAPVAAGIPEPIEKWEAVLANPGPTPSATLTAEARNAVHETNAPYCIALLDEARYYSDSKELSMHTPYRAWAEFRMMPTKKGRQDFESALTNFSATVDGSCLDPSSVFSQPLHLTTVLTDLSDIKPLVPESEQSFVAGIIEDVKRSKHKAGF